MTTPPDIVFEDEVFDVALHPTESVIASGLITGELFIHTYTAEEVAVRGVVHEHEGAVRALAFSDDGSYLFSASSDCSLMCTNPATGEVVYRHTNAHKHGINALLVIEGTGLVATGDDEGVIKIWNLQDQTCFAEYHAHEDYIADMVAIPHKKMIFAAGGDGRLSVYNWAKKKHKVSDQLEDELLSIAIMKGTQKVAAGTQSGAIVLYSWGKWGDYTDRLLGHPQSVDAMVKVDENTLVTGSSDGILRVTTILPNKIKGVLGEHHAYPVERIHASKHDPLLASCSHDKRVKFWAIEAVESVVESGGDLGAGFVERAEQLADDDDDDDDDDDQEDEEEGDEEEVQVQTGDDGGDAAAPEQDVTTPPQQQRGGFFDAL
eukprot:m.55215 g.55215  ORF g.55215 m.55215 type:complete len:376 (+) comp11471_c1_seq1:251-1378(+)